MHEPTWLQQRREWWERILSSLPAAHQARLIYSNKLTKCIDVRIVPFCTVFPYDPFADANVAVALQRFLDESSRLYAVYFVWMTDCVILYFQSLSDFNR